MLEEDILSQEDFECEARHWLDDIPNLILQDELTEYFIGLWMTYSTSIQIWYMILPGHMGKMGSG